MDRCNERGNDIKDKNKVWKLTELPSGCHTIPNRWIFKVKTDCNGNIERHRARLVIKGYAQKTGIDFHETFSPVARFDTIRSLLSISAEKRMHLMQFDIKTAFLHGELEEQIYMDQPEYFHDGTDRVCLLQKSLYGLRQAPRAFNEKFANIMMQNEYSRSKADNCLFTKLGEETTYVVHYVDDGIVATTNENEFEELFTHLRQTFEISVKPLSHFLGIHVHIDSNHNIHINQAKYIEETLAKFGMQECKSTATPADANLYSNTSLENDTRSERPYRELIGSLMYMAIATRPDIAFTVSILSRYLDKHTGHHWTCALRALRYLRATTRHGITYSGPQNTLEKPDLQAYSDADFANDPETRRSVSGQIIINNNGPIVWASNQQKVVTLSSTEAEFLAACEATKSLLWIKQIFLDFGLNVTPTLKIDNLSAIRLIKNPEYHRRTKHIDIKYQFIREKYNSGEILFEHVPSAEQAADIFTKPLSKPVFTKLRDLIGITPSS